jgi:hypothetical protein
MTPSNFLFDRVFLEERIATELSFAARHGTALALMLLRPEPRHDFAERLATLVRVEDLVAQFDDRTYAVLVRGLPPPAMRQMAERLCALFTRARTPASIGFAPAETGAQRDSVSSLLRRAVAALERAHAAGGARVKA